MDGLAGLARSLAAVRTDDPHLITPRVDPGVPALSLGRYAGARRRAIVAVKEHGRADLVAPLAGALEGGRLSRLDLILGEWSVAVPRSSLRRFWRRALAPAQWERAS